MNLIKDGIVTFRNRFGSIDLKLELKSFKNWSNGVLLFKKYFLYVNCVFLGKRGRGRVIFTSQVRLPDRYKFLKSFSWRCNKSSNGCLRVRLDFFSAE
jgi:hypothetical protein